MCDFIPGQVSPDTDEVMLICWSRRKSAQKSLSAKHPLFAMKGWRAAVSEGLKEEEEGNAEQKNSARLMPFFRHVNLGL